MASAEMLVKEINSLPAYRIAQVFDFVEFIKQKEVQEGCPICARHRDPETGELRFNAETISAFEEGDAMLRGEIPAKRFNSLEEMLADLDE